MLTLTFPHSTALHRLRPGVKMAVLALFSLGLFRLRDPVLLLLVLGGVAGLHLIGGRAMLAAGARALRPYWPFVLLIMAWHLVTRAPLEGAVILLRMAALIAAANLVTMTTRLQDMLGVIEAVLRPLSPLLPPRRLALAFALVIRFIPRMGEVMGQLRAAWSARSPRRPGWRILVPTALAALDDADHVAESLRARGGAP